MILKQLKKLVNIFSVLLAILVDVGIEDSVEQPKAPEPYFLYFLYIIGVLFAVFYLVSLFHKKTSKKLEELGPLLAGGVLILNIINIVCSKYALLPVLFFPSLDRVFGVFVNDRELMLECILSSGKLLLIGFSVGASLGFFTGVLIGFNKKSKIFKNLPKEMPWNSQILFTREQVKKQAWPDTESPKKDRTAPKGIIKSLTVQYWFDKNRVLSHPNQSHCFTPRSALGKFKTIPEGDVAKKSFKRLHRWRYSPTAAYGNNEVHIHPYEARRISAAEALAIQSLPKEFVLPPDMSLSDMFKTIGNGVPYKAAYGIAKTILEFINYKYEDNSGKHRKSNK